MDGEEEEEDVDGEEEEGKREKGKELAPSHRVMTVGPLSSLKFGR